MKIPVYKPYISDLEKKNVLQCLEDGWISSQGKYISQFETEFAHYTGAKHAISVSNGTTALHVALLAAGVTSDDEVIIPSLTYIATANCVSYIGAKIRLADSKPDTWNIDPDSIRQLINKKTKAIVVVHLYGNPCDMSAIAEICKEYNLLLIEDCAEAIGSKINGKHVGIFGDIASFSFYGNKTITCGEGGMVITNDTSLADRARKIKGQGLANNRQYYHDIIGYNYRMTNICAALGVAQMAKLHNILIAKSRIFMAYYDRLSNDYEFQTVMDGHTNSYWMVSMLAKNEQHRDEVRKHLSDNGVETRPFFYPINAMPMYSDLEDCDVCNKLSARGFNVPSFPELEVEEVNFICNLLLEKSVL